MTAGAAKQLGLWMSRSHAGPGCSKDLGMGHWGMGIGRMDCRMSRAVGLVTRGVAMAAIVSVSLIGVAQAQSGSTNPPGPSTTRPTPVEPNGRTIPPPIKKDIDQPVPGSQREARACSADIARLCATETRTRRNLRACFKEKQSQFSDSCKAFIKRSREKSKDD